MSLTPGAGSAETIQVGEHALDQRAAQSYRLQRILTASPAMRVVMLYDEATRCLNDVVRAVENKNVKDRWAANNRAQMIIEYLRGTLNMEKGGEIAANLDKIYGYILGTLHLVDVHNDAKPARDAILLLEPLRTSWTTLARQPALPAPDMTAAGRVAVSA